MRRYEEDFNEEYERGYEDGRRAVLAELDEADSGFEEIKRQITKMARKEKFSVKNNYKGLLRGGIGTLVTGFYFDLMFNEEVYVIDIPEHRDASVSILNSEVQFLVKAEALLKTIIK